MNFRNRPARVAAATGAVVVAGAATMLAVAAGTASADEPGRCVQNVNIREEPDAQSRIVALCEAGTKVQLGDERDGWVHIDELGGWASKDFVKPDESTARSDSSSGDRSEGVDGHSSRDGDSSGSSDSDSSGSGSHGSGSPSSGSHESDSGDGERSSGASGADDAHIDGLLG
jgi:SH3 domain-containing protein